MGTGKEKNDRASLDLWDLVQGFGQVVWENHCYLLRVLLCTRSSKWQRFPFGAEYMFQPAASPVQRCCLFFPPKMIIIDLYMYKKLKSSCVPSMLSPPMTEHLAKL